MEKRNIILLFLFLIGFTTLLSSCDHEQEYEKWAKRENIVRFKVFCNNPTAHVKVWGAEEPPIIIMESWEKTYITTSDRIAVRATSDDKLSTVKIQCFVNGTLVDEESDYYDVTLGYKLK